jgi:hypothetical protein
MSATSIRALIAPLFRFQLPAGSLIATLFAVVASTSPLYMSLCGQISLRFGLVAAALAALGAAYLTLATLKPYDIRLAIDLKSLWVAFLFSVVLCLLGGEGRFFFANVDWETRDALLNDLVRQHWPFVYEVDGTRLMLRAPLAIYLWPAIAGKTLSLSAARFAFLVQNVVLLTCLLGTLQALFQRFKDRSLLLIVVVFFSGLDIVGYLFSHIMNGRLSIPDHIEWWSGFQYSSTITQIFWVPHHFFPAAIFAVMYLLWLDRRAPAGIPLAAIPLLGIWSPLALIGTLPFGAHTAWSAIRNREVKITDLLLPVLSVALSGLCLWYLQSGTEGVPKEFGFPPAMQHPGIRYLLFLSLELVPFLFLLYASGQHRRFGPWTVHLIAVVLILVPLIRIGEGEDFCMRASMPALFILSVLVATRTISLCHANGSIPARAMCRFSVAILLLGSVTGMLEMMRALRLDPVTTDCGFVTAWRQSAFAGASYATYLAKETSMPPLLRPERPTIVKVANEAGPCWINWEMPK